MNVKTPLMSALLTLTLATALACTPDPPASTYKSLEEQGFLDENGNVVRADEPALDDTAYRPPELSEEEERRRAGFVDVADIEAGELDPPPTTVVTRGIDDSWLLPEIPERPAQDEQEEDAKPAPRPVVRQPAPAAPKPREEAVLGLTREQIRAQFGGEIAEDQSGGYVPTVRKDNRAPEVSNYPARETAASRKAPKLKPGVKGQPNIPGLPQIPMTQKDTKQVVAPSDAPASEGTVVRP